jgi:quercetin dioxygenase-like cupin family protein
VNDTTSGSETREARTLDDPVMGFDLEREVALLRAEPGYAQFGRSSKTLGKGAHFRLVVTAARAGTAIGNEEADDAVAVQVLEGTVTVEPGGAGTPVGRGSVIWFSAGEDWSVRVEQDAALVLSIGWPGDDATTGRRTETETPR